MLAPPDDRLLSADVLGELNEIATAALKFSVDPIDPKKPRSDLQLSNLCLYWIVSFAFKTGRKPIQQLQNLITDFEIFAQYGSRLDDAFADAGHRYLNLIRIIGGPDL